MTARASGGPPTRMGGLRLYDPAAWHAQVRAALELHRALAPAAAELGVARRTLQRWLTEEPSLSEGLDLPQSWTRMVELQRTKRLPASGSEKKRGRARKPLA